MKLRKFDKMLSFFDFVSYSLYREKHNVLQSKKFEEFWENKFNLEKPKGIILFKLKRIFLFFEFITYSEYKNLLSFFKYLNFLGKELNSSEQGNF